MVNLLRNFKIRLSNTEAPEGGCFCAKCRKVAKFREFNENPLFRTMFLCELKSVVLNPKQGEQTGFKEN